jgi:hypothetical protein
MRLDTHAPEGAGVVNHGALGGEVTQDEVLIRTRDIMSLQIIDTSDHDLLLTSSRGSAKSDLHLTSSRGPATESLSLRVEDTLARPS